MIAKLLDLSERRVQQLSREGALNEIIAAIEAATGREAQRSLMPMQPGDVPSTWADASLVEALVGKLPRTDIREGVRQFVDWYRGWNAAE